MVDSLLRLLRSLVPDILGDRLLDSIPALLRVSHSRSKLIPDPSATLAPVREPMSFEVADLSVNSSGYKLTTSYGYRSSFRNLRPIEGHRHGRLGTLQHILVVRDREEIDAGGIIGNFRGTTSNSPALEDAICIPD